MKTPKSTAPAAGERAALVGYYAQNRAAAALILRGLQTRSILWARLGDITAGRVDDLQIATPNRLDVYQFKWSDYAGAITLHSLTTEKGKEPPLFRILADGWKERSATFPDREVHVHFVTNNYAAKTENVSTDGAVTGQKHFAAFVSNGWLPVQSGEKEYTFSAGPWQQAWRSIAASTGLGESEMLEFVKHCDLQFQANFQGPPTQSAREADAWENTIRQFVERLFALPSEKQKQIELDRAQLLDFFGLSEETLPRHRHEFRLSEHVCESIGTTASAVHSELDRTSKGYLCLVGAPGSGKSTLLTQIMRQRAERVIRYYAFTPDGPNSDRGESVNFLADLVGELDQLGFSSRSTAPHKFDRLLLLERFRNQIQAIGERWKENGAKVVILIDGLDHIEREQRPIHSLLNDLPRPEEIPDGLVFVLGTQTENILRADVQAILRTSGKIIAMDRLSATAIRHSLRNCGLDQILAAPHFEEIIGLTNGHPLALGYLVRRLQSCKNSEDVAAVLSDTAPYEGDIEVQYHSLWTSLGVNGFKVRHLLGLIARLRISAETAWLRRWADREALDRIEQSAGHFFHRESGFLQFFHNSFRVFILNMTAKGHTGQFDPNLEIEFHEDLANHCASANSSPLWKWEELFHRSEAGQHQKVLNLATPVFFRQQFYEWRPRRRIFGDLFLAEKSLATISDGLAAVRIALIKNELEARFEAFQLEEQRLLETLMRNGRQSDALRRVREGCELLVGHDTGIEVCRLLHELGESDEAKRLIDLIDPHACEHMGFSLDHLAEQRGKLVSWSLAALPLLGIEEVLGVLRSHPFVVKSDGPTNEAADVPRQFNLTLAQLAAVLLEEQNFDFGMRIAEEVDWSKVPGRSRRRFVLAQAKVCLTLNRPVEGSEAIEELVSHLDSVKSEDERLEITETLVDHGRLDDAKALFSTVKQPSFEVLGGQPIYAREHSLSGPRWLRLCYLLTESAPYPLANAVSAEEEGMVLCLRARSAVAKLWAASRKGFPLDQYEVARKFSDIFRPLNQDHKNLIQWRNVNNIPHLFHEIGTELIQTCAEIGPEFLDSIAVYLFEEWKRPGGYWISSVKRDLVAELLRAGLPRQATQSALVQIETEFDAADNASSRVGECIAQAEIWTLVDDKERAMASIELGQKLALGIEYHKDYQLSRWLQLLRDAWAEDPTEMIPFAENLARSIVALQHQVGSGALHEAAELLVAYVFPIDARLGARLWNYLQDAGCINFSDTLSALLHELLKAGKIEFLPIIKQMMVDFVFPLKNDASPEFLSSILQTFYSVHGRDKTREFADELAISIETVVRPSARKGWWCGLRIAAARLKLSIDHPAWSEDSRQSPFEVAAQILEASDALKELKNIFNLELEKKAKSPHHTEHLDWTEIVRQIAPSLDGSQALELLDIFSSHHAEARIGAIIAPLLVQHGKAEHAWILGQKILSRIQEDGGSRYSGFQQRLNAFLPLLHAKPEIAQALLYKSFAEDGWLTPDDFHALGPWMLPSPETRHSFYAEITKHVHSIVSGTEHSAPEVPASSTLIDGIGTALNSFIREWMEHPTGIVRHSASRAAHALTFSSDPHWTRHIREVLDSHLLPVSEIFLVFDETARLTPEALFPFKKEIASWAQEPDLSIRWRCRRICERCGWPPPDEAPSQPLSPALILQLPEIDPDGISDILKALGNRLALVAKATGIPMANLYHQIETLASEIRLEQSFLDLKKNALEYRLRNLGLEFMYRLPSAIVAERSILRLLGHLQDAGKIPAEATDFLCKLFSMRDSWFVSHRPTQRPNCFAPPSSSWEDQPWSKDWLAQALAIPSSVPVDKDGWTILSYCHEFRIHTDRLPEEGHFGTLLPKQWPAPEHMEGNHPPFEEVCIFSTEEYAAWRESPQEPLLCVQPREPLDWPYSPWLALHPAWARAAGWEPESSYNFAWKNQNGLVAKSAAWVDGRPGGMDRHERDYTGSGWYVAVSPEGLAELQEALGTFQFHAHADRWHSR